MFRRASVAVVALVLAGCMQTGDDTDRHDRKPHGAHTVEKMSSSAMRKLSNAIGDAYDEVGEKLDGGKVLSREQVQSTIDKAVDDHFKGSFDGLNRMFQNAAKDKRYGRTQAKLFHAAATGFHEVGGGERDHDDKPDDDEGD